MSRSLEACRLEAVGTPETRSRRDEAVRMREKGMSLRKIAAVLKVPVTTVVEGCGSAVKQTDRSTLEMALIGYEAELKKIEATIAAIRKQVDGHAAAPTVEGARQPKRNMSVAARRRIAAAQRKRWAAFHAEKKGRAAKVAPKRKPSAAAKGEACVEFGEGTSGEGGLGHFHT